MTSHLPVSSLQVTESPEGNCSQVPAKSLHPCVCICIVFVCVVCCICIRVVFVSMLHLYVYLCTISIVFVLYVSLQREIVHSLQRLQPSMCTIRCFLFGKQSFGTSLGERGETVFVQIVLVFLIFCLYLNLLCVRKQTSAIVEHHSRELFKATHPPFNFNSSQAPVTKLSLRENSAAPYKQRFSKHQNLHTMFTSMSATLSTSMSKGNLMSKKL